MHEYDYSTYATPPDTDTITTETAASAMVNKSLQYMHWKSSERKLHCFFDFELDQADKPIFDDIVESNL